MNLNITHGIPWWCSIALPKDQIPLNTINIHIWLVVYLPLWKMMDFVSWDDEIPIWTVIKFHGSKPPPSIVHHQIWRCPIFLDQPFVATHWWSVWTTVRSLSGKVGPMWLAFPTNKTPVLAQGYYVRWKLALVCLVCWYIWYCRCLKITMTTTSH